MVIDREILEADIPPAMPVCPHLDEVAAIRRERDIWLVASAQSNAFSSAQLAKAAGFRTMSGYRQALSRARRRLEALNASD